jgi:hypothetical protein
MVMIFIKYGILFSFCILIQKEMFCQSDDLMKNVRMSDKFAEAGQYKEAILYVKISIEIELIEHELKKT